LSVCLDKDGVDGDLNVHGDPTPDKKYKVSEFFFKVGRGELSIAEARATWNRMPESARGVWVKRCEDHKSRIPR